MKPRILYIECKAAGLAGGVAHIGRATFSKSGRTVYHGGREFQRMNGYKANHFEVGTGAAYWISGPRRDGADRLYGERIPIEIDDDVREEYWRDIRGEPERSHETNYY